MVSFDMHIKAKKIREGLQLDPKLALHTNGDAKLAQTYN
jgi:hypothetical protein